MNCDFTLWQLTNAPSAGIVSQQSGKIQLRRYTTLPHLRRSNRALRRGFSYSGDLPRNYGRAYRAAQAGCPSFRKARSVVVSLYVQPPEHTTSGGWLNANLRRLA